MDFTRATDLTPDVEEAISDAFDYHPWSEAQRLQGKLVKDALVAAVAAARNPNGCKQRHHAQRKILSNGSVKIACSWRTAHQRQHRITRPPDPSALERS